MELSKEDIAIIFNEWLTSYCLPRSSDHLKCFESLSAGNILTRRLFKVLRDNKLSHFMFEDKIGNIPELFHRTEEFFKKYKKIFIVGLNYWVTDKDLEVIRRIYEKKFC